VKNLIRLRAYLRRRLGFSDKRDNRLNVLRVLDYLFDDRALIPLEAFDLLTVFGRHCLKLIDRLLVTMDDKHGRAKHEEQEPRQKGLNHCESSFQRCLLKRKG